MSLITLPRLVVVGASAGGVEALLAIAAGLPADFAVPILIVHHIGANHSYLPELLNRHGSVRACFGSDGEVPQPRTLYVAPSDFHMTVEAGRLRIGRGPKEQHTRPAIDPLFRSAALESGRGVVGVVLSGMLDDGTAGLRAIKDCGGIVVVQDPAEAREPSMPASALAYVDVDHMAKADDIPGLLSTLVNADLRKRIEPPRSLLLEHAASLGGQSMEQLNVIGSPSAFTCPDCSGALFELDDKRPVRFVCHTGHAYSLRSLAFTQGEVTEAALWSSLRALQEKEALLRRLAAVQETERPGSGQRALSEAAELSQMTAAVRSFAKEIPSNQSFTPPA